MTPMLEKAARAVEDAMASDDNHPTDIVRAVLLAIRDDWLEIYHSTKGHALPTYEQAEGFPDMIDTILAGETET